MPEIAHPEIVYPLLIAIFLDSILGDPNWLPHPVRLFGWLISHGEKRLNTGSFRKLKGALFSAVLIGLTWSILKFGLDLISGNKYISLPVLVLFIFWGIANHGLIAESVKVIRELNKNGIDAGRKQLSFIVGRDTGKLSENEIRTAVLETLAENLSDGVIAPLCYYFIGGIPLMFAYKMANTLDSMIAYKNDRYKDFGWFAARFDDLVNIIPSRITALLMICTTFSLRGLKFVIKYGHKHASPNAGYPEAALAGIIKCRFGGPNIYNGKLVNKPYIGEIQREIFDQDIFKACAINGCSMVLLLTVYLLLLQHYF